MAKGGNKSRTMKITKMTAKGMRKRCSKCTKWKDPLTEFGKHKSEPLGVQPYCLICTEKYRRRWRKTHSAVHLQHIKSYTASRKGVSAKWVKAQVAAQGGCCARCHEPFRNSKDTQIDHDHSCCPGRRSCGSCVRGVICWQCNQRLTLAYCTDHPKDVYLLAYSTRRAMVDEFVSKFSQRHGKAA